MFHRVLPADLRDQYPLPGIAVTPDELHWFLRFFREHFVVGSLVDMAAAWLGETGASGPPRLALTFDDGQRDNALHALPVLRELDVRATFFPVVEHVESGRALWHDRLAGSVRRLLEDDPVGARAALRDMSVGVPDGDLQRAVEFVVEEAKTLEPELRLERVERIESLAAWNDRAVWDEMMSWDDLSVLVADGHEIGSHSMTHALLPQCSDEELREEIDASRRILQDRLGVECASFCYPNGSNDSRSARAVADAGYRFAVTTQWGTNARSADLHRLDRCNMNARQMRDRKGRLSEERLAWRISGLHPGLR